MAPQRWGIFSMSDGDWQGLAAAEQGPRYAAIARMLEGSLSILDVGCGEGVLLDWLAGHNYIGIDRSVAAVISGRTLRPSATLINCSATDFQPKSKVDAVVFNEMLYYVADPVGMVRRFSAHLRPGGRVVCSIYRKAGRPSWRQGLAHALDRRRPMSNVHCEELVREFMRREKWQTLADELIPIPGTELHWSTWCSRPQERPV